EATNRFEGATRFQWGCLSYILAGFRRLLDGSGPGLRLLPISGSPFGLLRQLLKLLAQLLQLDADGVHLIARSGLRLLEQRLQLGLRAVAQRLPHLARLLLELARPRGGLRLRLLECLVELRLELVHRSLRVVAMR